ncbi:hypothetical protein BCR34DRAFT_584530 [Clohesyomyces aquaticus]|uniref:Uncharacterized protein n=1 Tax=Clohesyomyces aquaticus TaxID=1231657 RepID=A0A1Y2A0U0_9PLEO|nr:hypothetical protein BCR34DRAFT_584530 [Clohesyomyces aquaticus]
MAYGRAGRAWAQPIARPLFVWTSFAEELAVAELTNTCDVDLGKLEGSAADNNGDNLGEGPDEAIEAQLICTNKSFDVASIAALCVSCKQQNGNGTTDGMDNLMSACSFSGTSYSRSASALILQITVSATKLVADGLATVSSTAMAQGQATQAAASAGLGARTIVSGAEGFSITLLALVPSVGMFYVL